METTSNLGINHGNLAGCLSCRGGKYAGDKIFNTLKGALNFYTSRVTDTKETWNLRAFYKILLLLN